MKKEERLARKEREDQALNRVLWWFGGAVVLEFFVLLLNRYFINFNTRNFAAAAGIFRFLQIFSAVCLALAVVFGVLWMLWRKGQKKGTFLFGVCALIALALFLCAFIAGMWKDTGVQLLYVAVPVVAVLALVYYLYQREFFLVAIQGGVALFAMWAYTKLIYVNAPLVYGILIAAAVLAVAAAALAAVLQRSKGRLGKKRILSKRCNYVPLYLASAVTLLAVILAFCFGISVAYGALLGVVAWLFGAAVYYTVHLM